MGKVSVGMVGGGQVAKPHVVGYVNAPVFYPLRSTFKMEFIAEITESLAKAAAAKYGFARWTSDWRKVTADPRVDLVDVVTPTHIHKAPAIDALEHGKHVISEKPLATSATDAREMYDAARKAGVTTLVGFNYRRVPAVTQARRMIKEGRLGRIYHVRSQFFEDWGGPEHVLTWRFQRKTAGAGVLADLGSHALDMVRFLVGEVSEVCAMSESFTNERPLPGGKKKGPSDVDDITVAMLRLQSGATAEMSVSWVATGRKVGLGFEVHGSEGSLYFDMERPNEIKYYSASDGRDAQGFRTVYFGPEHEYGSSLIFGAPTMGTGYVDSMVAQMRDLAVALEKNGQIEPSFYDGWKVSQLIDAVIESSERGAWVNVK